MVVPSRVNFLLTAVAIRVVGGVSDRPSRACLLRQVFWEVRLFYVNLSQESTSSNVGIVVAVDIPPNGSICTDGVVLGTEKFL